MPASSDSITTVPYNQTNKTNTTHAFGPEPAFPVEKLAWEFMLQQRKSKAWMQRECSAFAFFVDYLRKLQVQDAKELDEEFLNNLRSNIYETFMEGSLNALFLTVLIETINHFLLETGICDQVFLFDIDDITYITRQRQSLAPYSEDAFLSVLDELRLSRLHTDAALLEVIRYTGVSLKEALLMNPSLALESALANGYIVVRNQSGKHSRQVPIWNSEQMKALHKLAVNRIKHFGDESYRSKIYSYLLLPPNQIAPRLKNYGMCIFSIRRQYFREEFYRRLDPARGQCLTCNPKQNGEYKFSEIKKTAFEVSQLLGYQFCFDDNFPISSSSESLREIISAQALIETHPRVFVLGPEVLEYLQPFRIASKHM